MALYDVDELVKWGRKPVMCPHCVNGPMHKGWDTKYRPIQARVAVDRIVAKDANGEVRMTLFHRVIVCMTHGTVAIEEQM